MVDVLHIIGQYVELKKRAATNGGEYAGPCPWCEDGTDRFRVWPEPKRGKSNYWCRQCGKSGDAIQFLRDYSGLTFHEACERVGRDPDRDRPAPYTGPAQPKNRRRDWQPESAGAAPPAQWMKKARTLVDWSFERLMHADDQIQWLTRRGIPEQAAARWGVGYNPGNDGKDIFRPRPSWGLEAEKKKNGRDKAVWIPRGITIPWVQKDGRVWRIRIRRPEGEPRYYVIPGSAMDCFMAPDRHRAYVVVESELDAIMLEYALCHHREYLAGVVALGNSSRRPDVRTWAALKSAAVVLVALDFDGAGAKAWPWWQANLKNAIQWPVPQGKDPGEAYEAGEDMWEWVRAGLPKAWFMNEAPGASCQA